jgi:hypothetical protein
MMVQDVALEQVKDLIAQADILIRSDSLVEFDPSIPMGSPRSPIGEPIVIDGFAFLNFVEIANSSGSPTDHSWPPEDMSKLHDIVRNIRNIEKKTGEPFNRIIGINNTSTDNLGFSMNMQGRLNIGCRELTQSIADDELDAVLLHEQAHYLYGDGEIPLDGIEWMIKPETPDSYFYRYTQDPDVTVNELSNRQKDFIVSTITDMRKSNAICRQFATEFYESLKEDPLFDASPDTIIYDMEAKDDRLRKTIKSTVENIYGKFDLQTEKIGISTDNQSIRKYFETEIEENQNIKQTTDVILNMLRSVKHAQEMRADRYMARYANNPAAFISYLQRIVPSSLRYGTADHPAVVRRAEDIADTTEGRAIDEWAATGAFIDEIAAIPNTGPVRSPEMQSNEEKYKQWTKNIGNPSATRRRGR